MSVEYRNLTGIGIVCKTKQDIKDYIKSHSEPTEQELEALNEADVEDYLDFRKDGLEIECLNLFSGQWYFFGYKLSKTHPEEFVAQTLKASEKWKTTFGQTGKVVFEVCVF